MDNLILSIIVPVYNIENYLSNCLDSIIKQDFSSYELILINDGSTDASGKICDKYALAHKNIKVLHQTNSGVSAARNLGLKNARGQWVCFVDGDDELSPNSLEALLKERDNCDLEVIIARSFNFEEGELKKENYKFNKSFLSKTFEGYNLITQKSYIRGSVCGCIFKRNFLKDNNLKFPVGLKNSEDSIFIALVHLYANYILFLDINFYLVNKREGSASRNWTFERVFKMIDNIQFINNYKAKHLDLNNNQKHILDYSIYVTVSNIFNNLYYCLSIYNYHKILKAVSKALQSKIDVGNITISKGKVEFLNASLFLFSFTVLINQKFRHLTK